MCGGGGRLVDPGESVTHTERPRGQGKRMWWAWAWGSTAPPLTPPSPLCWLFWPQKSDPHGRLPREGEGVPVAPRSHAPPSPRTGCPRRWQVPSHEEAWGRPSGALLTVRSHLTSGSLS